MNRWHGDNGAWVYGQCCGWQAGHVVGADVVCQYYDEFGDEGCGDWSWWDTEAATQVRARFSNKNPKGPNELLLLRAAENVIEYISWYQRGGLT